MTNNPIDTSMTPISPANLAHAVAMIKHYGDERWGVSNTADGGIAFDMHDLQNRIDQDGVSNTVQFLIDALKEGYIKPEEFSIRQLAECFLPDGLAQINAIGTLSTETTAPLMTLLGAIVETKVKEAFNHKDFVIAKSVQTLPSHPQGERICLFPFTEDLSGAVLDHENPDKLVELDQYVDTPEVTHRGLSLAITKEMVLKDQTHVLLQLASKVGLAFGISKEQQIINAIAGVDNTAPPFVLNGQEKVFYAMQQSQMPWVNRSTNMDLNIESIFNARLYISENLRVRNLPDHYDILATTRNTFLSMDTVNQIEGSSDMRLIRSEYLWTKVRMISITGPLYWWIGDFSKAFAYMESGGITLLESDTHVDTNHVVCFDISEKGVAALINPLYVVQCLV